MPYSTSRGGLLSLSRKEIMVACFARLKECMNLYSLPISYDIIYKSVRIGNYSIWVQIQLIQM